MEGLKIQISVPALDCRLWQFGPLAFRVRKPSSPKFRPMKRTSFAQSFLRWAAAVALFASASTVLQADQSLTHTFNLPMQVNGTVNSSDCNNKGGPQVTLDGEISLGGLQV